MTERRPLVRIDGEFKQLPVGDSITGSSGGSAMPIVFPIEEVILQSQTWVARVSGWHRITAIGGGGAGGKLFRDVALARRLLATGGGAGGTARKMVWLNAGDSLIITIGSGGLMNLTLPQVVANGNDGGDTTVVGSDINLIARGGKAGKAAFYFPSNSASVMHSVVGSAGGTASGGDVNLTGGGSGDAVIKVASMPTNWASNYSALAMTGGGCVSLTKPVGHKSGLAYCCMQVDAASANANYIVVANTCGAGIGGDSGNCSVTHTTGTPQLAGGVSGGCGTFSGSADQVVNLTSNTFTSSSRGNGLTDFGAGLSSRLLGPNGAPPNTLAPGSNLPVGTSAPNTNTSFTMTSMYAPFSGFPPMVQTTSTPIKNQATLGGGGGPIANSAGILTTDASYTHGGNGGVIIEAPM